VYNGLPWIETTIGSVLTQSVADFEVIVRDDFSTDGTWQFLVARFKNDPRVRLLRNEGNVDIGEQYNRLFDDARGDIILKLDADDLIHPEFLERTLPALEKNGADVVATGWEWLAPDGSSKRPQGQVVMRTGRIHDASRIVLTGNPFSLCFTIFRRALLAQTIRDDRYVMHTETCDWEFQLRLAMAGAQFYYIQEVLGQYRLHERNRSRTANAQFESILRDVLAYWYADLVRTCGAGALRWRVLQLVRGHLSAVLRGQVPLSLSGLRAGMRLVAGRPACPRAVLQPKSASRR
jgi:glycosyltransferase involved in cell wall biosynthesis